MFVVAIEACPTWTVTGPTPRASHRHAAVCRRSWIRQPRTSRLSARPPRRAAGDPSPVVSRSSSGPLPSAQRITSGSTRSATGTRRPLPDFVAFAFKPFGCGARDEHDRHRDPDEVTDPQLAHLRPPQARPRRHDQEVRQVLVPGSDRHVEGLELVLGERPEPPDRRLGQSGLVERHQRAGELAVGQRRSAGRALPAARPPGA
jgi:hypothetical protein